MCKRQHVSYSQLSKLEDCSLCWYFAYVQKLKKPATIQMFTGTCFHAAMEHANRFLIEDVVLDIADVLDSFSRVYDAGIGEVELKPGQSKRKFKETGLLALETYWKSVGSTIKPIATETKLTRPIPGLDYDFVGIVDTQTTDGKVIDYKLTGKKWNETDTKDTNKQATAYAFLLDKEEIDFEFHIVTREAVPKVQIINVGRSYLDVRSYLEYVKRSIDVMEGIKEGLIPVETRSGYCNEHMCSYYQECQSWKYDL